MAKTLKPVKKSIYNSFVAAATNIAEAAQVTLEWSKGDLSAKKAAERLAKHAADGDQNHITLVKLINATFVTPFDRADIYNLSSHLDQVMDHIEAAVGIADAAGWKNIETVPAEIASLTRILKSSSEVTSQAMADLKSMKNLERYWIEMTRLEDEADLVYRALLANIFNGDLPVMTVLKLKAVADELEAAINSFEAVAHVVETVLVKES